MKRTTIELDPELLERAMTALGTSTMRETVEIALRRVAEGSEAIRQEHARRQWESLQCIGENVDLDVLASEEMWR